MFLSDLVRALDDRVTLDFIAVSSYGESTKSSGEVRLVKDVDAGLEGRHVVIVEDIVDTGLTLHYLQDILRAPRPRVAPHRLPPEQALAAEGGREGRLHRLHHRRPLRRRLRPRLRRAAPQPALHRLHRRTDPVALTGRPSAPARTAFLRVLQDLRLVQRPHHAVSHQHPAVARWSSPRRLPASRRRDGTPGRTSASVAAGRRARR